jgi:uncharacterized protein (DUF2336 family)
MFKGLFGKGKNKPEQEISRVAALDPLPSGPEILKTTDPERRSRMAARPDVPPEVLFVLAADPNVDVRRNVAGNPSTPAHVTPMLARDGDVDVRTMLLGRLVRLLPQLTPEQHGELYDLTVAGLETLARDQVKQVREALANTIKDVAYAPNAIVAHLAHDMEQTVAEPVLRFCAALTDEDLLDVIANHPKPWTLAAIAARQSVSAPVSDAIAFAGDIKAGSLLLDNKGAILAEGTLEEMIEQAFEVPEWQERLAARPSLPRRLALRLAEFVDKSVMSVLEKRRDFDDETMKEIMTVTRRRLEYAEVMKSGGSPSDRAEALHKKKKLDEAVILDALSWNDHEFVIAGIGLLSHVPLEVGAAILQARNGKAITALAWKAGLSMRAAIQLQTRMAHINGRELVVARHGDSYPLSESDMIWQLEFAGATPASK